MPKSDIQINVPQDTLDTWQEMVDIMAEIVGIPAGLIMRLKDPDIEVFVSSKSEGNPYHPGDKEEFWGSGLYCETVIKSEGRLLIPNALEDPDWATNPDVKLNMISYLGFPIRLPNNKPFGTLCVLDSKRNEYYKTAEKLMLKFRDLIESHLAMIFLNESLGDRNRQLTDYLREIQALRGLVPICAKCKSIRDKEDHWHPIEHYLIQHPEAQFSHGICPTCQEELYPGQGKNS